MNLTEDEKKRLFESLARLEENQQRTNQALFGDEQIGLQGVVLDVKSLKMWRNEVVVRTSYISGVVAFLATTLTLFGKFIVYKITGKE